MSEGDSHDRVLGNRNVLGDLTNKCGNRGFPLVSGRFVIRNKTCGYQENPKGKVEDADSERKVYGSIDSTKGKGKVDGLSERDNVECRDEDGISFLNAKQTSRSVSSAYGGDPTQANAELDVPHILNGSKEISSSLNCNLQLISGEAVVHEIMEADRSRDSCISISSVPWQCKNTKDLSAVLEQVLQEDCKTGSTDFMRYTIQTERGHDKSSASYDGSLEFMVSKESKVDGGECLTQESSDKSCSEGSLNPSGSLFFKKCNLESMSKVNAAFHSESSTNIEDIMGSVKSCPCSFCLKAAYMWTDLHYQDAKGRLAALKKSRKYARSLEGRSYSHEHTDKIARDNSKKSRKLEFDLMQHWSSLFLHTEDVLVRECTQLHSNLLKLKELRGKCKRELEMISTVSSNKS